MSVSGRRELKVRLWTALILASILAFTASPTSAQPLELVKDITFTTSQPGLAKTNVSMFFNANDGTNGLELWKSDGTPGGTVMVKDIQPGPADFYIFDFIDINGTLFFSGFSQLWKSDGTNAGTVLVKDFTSPGAVGFLTEFNNTLFFLADDGSGKGRELWKSDGTPGGTVIVKDIQPGPGDSHPAELTVVNGTLFFAADDGVSGYELWKSDGTELGTVRVRDIIPGSGGSFNLPLWLNWGLLTNLNGTLFFVATDGVSGYELWKSDGTELGTVMVKDIWPGINGSLNYLTNVNGTLFFTANDGTTGSELWKSDGTNAGTVLVADINPGIGSSGAGDVEDVNGTLFFVADDGTHGGELWKSDGTLGGTALAKDIVPGSGSSFSFPENLINVNGTLFFTANDGTTGKELWKSDGTPAGTVLVEDLNPGVGDSFPGKFIEFQGDLYLVADNGTNGISGRVLYKLNVPIILELQGTMTGTKFCANDSGTGVKQKFKENATFNVDTSQLPTVTSVIQVQDPEFPLPFKMSGMALIKSKKSGVLQLFGDNGGPKELALSGIIKINKKTGVWKSLKGKFQFQDNGDPACTLAGKFKAK